MFHFLIIASVIRLQAKRDFRKAWYWNGEAHVVADDLPVCVIRASAQLRASRALNNGQPEQVWEIILEHADRAKVKPADLPLFVRPILDEISVDVAALDEGQPFTDMLDVLVDPVRRKVRSTGRTIQAHKSGGSDSDLDAAALAVLFCAPAVGSGEKKVTRDKIPESIREEMQVLCDLRHFQDCTRDQLEVAQKTFTNPKAATWLRNIYGNTTFDSVGDEAQQWSVACEQSNTAWQSLKPVINILTKEHQTLKADHEAKVFKEGSATTLIEHCKERLGAFNSDTLDTVMSAGKSACEHPSGVLSDDNQKSVLESLSQCQSMIRTVLQLEAANMHAVFEQSKWPVGAEDHILDGHLLLLTGARAMCHTNLCKIEKLRYIAADTEALLAMKGLKSWTLGCYDLRIKYLQNVKDPSKIWHSCERLFKEKAGVESGPQAWFLPGKSSKSSHPWMQASVFTEPWFTSISTLITEERDRRNQGQGDSYKSTYQDFAAKTSHGLQIEGKTKFMPDFPSGAGDEPTGKTQWATLMQDKTKCGEVVLAYQSVSSSKEDLMQHAAWLMLDISPQWSSHRRSALQVMVRMGACQRQVALLLSQSNAADNHKPDMTLVSVSAGQAHATLLKGCEQLRNAKHSCDSCLSAMVSHAEEGEVKTTNAIFLPQLQYFETMLASCVAVAGGFLQVAHNRLSSGIDRVSQRLRDLKVDWEANVATSLTPAERRKWVTRHCLTGQGLKRHEAVQPTVKELRELLEETKDQCKQFEVQQSISFATTEIHQANKYLSTMSLVGISVMSVWMHEKGRITYKNLQLSAKQSLQSVKDMDMWERNRKNNDPVAADFIKEFKKVMEMPDPEAA